MSWLKFEDSSRTIKVWGLTMASAYLGPERHPPLSVISESFQTKLNIPALLPEDMLSFGVEYEKTFYSLVDEYLQLGTTDKLVSVK